MAKDRRLRDLSPRQSGDPTSAPDRVAGRTGQDPTGGVSGGRVKTLLQAEMTANAYCREASLDTAQHQPDWTRSATAFRRGLRPS